MTVHTNSVDWYGRRRRAKLSRWHKFVLLIGYAALLYGAVRAVVYLLVLMNEAGL